MPYNLNHNILLISVGTHACIYSKSMRNNIIEYHNETHIDDWDMFINSLIGKRYIYNDILCYQLFPETDNKQYWGTSGIMSTIGAIIAKNSCSILNLDKREEPGYTIMSYVSKILFYIILFTFIFIIYKLLCV